MRKLIVKILAASAFFLTFKSALAYSLLGPVANGGDAWQIQANGFNPLQYSAPFGFIDGLSTGPKNVGEGYRRNTPVLYFTFDTTFTGFFGSNGTNAVAGAFNILNGLTNVDNYSAGLTEFPLQSSAINYQAQALQLYDLKSLTLASLMEQLGLADSVRYTWLLHARWNPTPSPCPINEEYLVTERNFDISPTPLTQLQYTPYVNDALYSYIIYEYCGAAPPAPLTAAAVAFASDPLNDNPPVSSGIGIDYLNLGQFYTGLTRDDVAGLRYLLQAANVNVESPAAGSLLQTTTTGPEVPFYTSDLNLLLSTAAVTDPSTLATNFPGLIISSTVTNYGVLYATTNIVTYLTNLNGSASGAPVLYTTTVISNLNPAVIVTNYVDTFANVITNSYSSSARAAIITTSNFNLIGSAYGSTGAPSTSISYFTVSNYPSGDYYIIPAGTCGWSFVKPLVTNVVFTTNITVSVTNDAGAFFSQSLVTIFTNHVYLAEQVSCNYATPPAAKYEGIERMQFVHVDYNKYDTTLGQFYVPITNNYTMSTVVTTNNNSVVIQNFQRVVTTPDFLFAAEDTTSLGGAQTVLSRVAPNWNQSNILPNLAGPGTIDPGNTLTFNKSGPVYDNVGPNFLNGPNYGFGFTYASFDGTTNAPVVYPNGTSIAALENEVFIQFSPLTLLAATHGVAYTATFTVTGGQSPYAWSLATGSSLPTGFTLSSGGVLSGTTTQTGTFDFVVQMTDSASTPHVIQRSYTLTIN